MIGAVGYQAFSSLDAYGYARLGGRSGRSSGESGVDAVGLSEESASAVGAPDTAPVSESGRPIREGEDGLTDQERQELEQLERRDREVRRHEQAHVAAGGAYVQGGAQYDYETGPDGQRYATGGHVRIDVSPEREPQSTIQKMRVVKRAALAPADPSPQDRSVHRTASGHERTAMEQLRSERQEAVEEAARPAAPVEEEEASTAQTDGAILAPAEGLAPKRVRDAVSESALSPAALAPATSRLDYSV